MNGETSAVVNSVVGAIAVGLSGAVVRTQHLRGSRLSPLSQCYGVGSVRHTDATLGTPVEVVW